MAYISTNDIQVPREKLDKWQNAVDILAEITEVNNAAITKVDPPELEMFLVSQTNQTSIKTGQRFKLAGLFCEEVINSDQALLVPNALKEARWQDKPGLETGLISYLGFPLKWPNGDFFGTICVHDNKENKYSAKCKKLMKQFQELIESHLEIIYQNQGLTTTLEKGFEMHKRLLPRKLPEIKNVALASYYQPAIKLGGDFYNYIKLDDMLLIYLVDVAGHNLDGAMLNIFIRETINSFLLFYHQEGEIVSPKELIQFIVSRYNNEDFPGDQLISLIIGVLDLTDMKFTFSNAGIQIAPIVINKEGKISSLKCKGVPISSAIEEEVYTTLGEKEINFAEGMTVFLTTDGLIEEKAAGSIYGEERLKKVVAANYCFPPDLINYQVKKDFEEFSGAKKGQDDITYLILKHKLPTIAKYEQTLKSNPEEICKIRKEIVDLLTPYSQDSSTLWLGLQEMVCNAVEHGNQMDLDKKIKIKIRVTKKYIKLTIDDEGAGFNWQAKINKENSLLGGRERGRGIEIACKAYDWVWYNQQGNKANLLKTRN